MTSDSGSEVAQPTGRVDAREHQQALRVAAHPGREVVQLEQAVEDVRVLLARLHGVQLGELAAEQDLVAPGDVDEHLGDAGPQGSLLLRDLDGDLVDRVERLGEPPDLVARLDRDRLDDDSGSVTRGLHPLDHPRHLVADLAGSDGQAAQRPGDPAGQADGEHQSQAEPEHGEHDEDQGLPLLVVARAARDAVDVGHQVRLRLGHRPDAGVGGADPLDRAAVVGVAVRSAGR